MNDDLLGIVKKIVAERGEEVLFNSRQLSAFLADLARDVPAPRKNALLKCAQHDFAQVLKNVDEAERANNKQRLAQKLHEEEGFAESLCGQTLDLLEAALFGEAPPKKALCGDCGKEQNEDWKTCPFCVKVEVPAANASQESGSVVSPISPDAQADIQKLNEKLRATKNGLIAAIAFCVIGVIGMIFMFLELDSARFGEARYRRYYNLTKPFWSIVVSNLAVGNWQDGTWINFPGSRLQSSQMRFLAPRITFNSTVDGEITFFIRIIGPDGNLSTGTNSPPGYTYSSTHRVHRRNIQMLRLGGWGSADSSHFPAGNYTVEVWHENILLASTRVTIHP